MARRPRRGKGADALPMSDEMLQAVAAQFRALAEPARLRLLQALREGARNVTELAEAAETSHANASKHLLVLADAGFVTRTQDGTKTLYALSDDSTERFCTIMCDRVSQQAAETLRNQGRSPPHPGPDMSLFNPQQHQALELR